MKEDLEQLPGDIQLQIYDSLIALRTYERQSRINAICSKIGEDHEEPFEISNIPGITELDVDDDTESLPQVIRTGYNMINMIWGEHMDFGSAQLTKCTMSLDDDKADEYVQVFRLNLQNDGGCSDALYDINTFKCVSVINDDGLAGDETHMVNVMKHALEDVEPETQLEDCDEELETYHQWLKEVSENNFANTAFSDEFTRMRSLLHERCVSRSSKKRAREE